MPLDPANTLYYRRARFTTRLPVDRRYSASHFWLLEIEPGRWRIGVTKFATRILGDLVELDFAVAVDDPVELGQSIGSIEGFKAVSDLYSVASGAFAGSNAALDDDPTLLDSDPYDRGWLYEVRGAPDPQSMTAAQYTALLDANIDRMLEQAHSDEGNGTCPSHDIS